MPRRPRQTQKPKCNSTKRWETFFGKTGGALVILLGDFNARILTNPGLPPHVGPNFFESTRPLGEQTEEVLENRDLFLDFLMEHDLVALNTLKARPSTIPSNLPQPGPTQLRTPVDGRELRPGRLCFDKKPMQKHVCGCSTPASAIQTRNPY